MKEENNTLKIFVFEIIKVKDFKKPIFNKEFEVDKPYIFLGDVFVVLQQIFTGIGNYSRPPTFQFNNLILTRNRLAN